MAEKIFDAQSNYGWGLTLNMTGKAPAINKRIFNTLNDAQAFADDYNDSAIEGLILSVVADENEKNNGIYFIKSIKTSENGEAAVLEKVASSGINDEVNAALNEEKRLREESDSEIKELIGEVGDGNTIVGLISDVNSVVETNSQTIADNKSEIDSYTINQKKISENPVLESDDLTVSESYTMLGQPAVNVTPGDMITTAISKIEVMLANTTLSLTAAINDLESRIGSPSEYDEDGNLLKEGTGLYKKYEELLSRIESL